MSATPRLQLPLLSTGQAQKETSVNEAFQTCDIVAAGAIEELPRNDPPASPVIGSCMLSAVCRPVTGGKAQFVAAFTSGGWRLLPPIEGMTFSSKQAATQPITAREPGKSGCCEARN